jgi:hypothetical protein
MYKNTIMYDKMNNVEKCTMIEICNINDIKERELYNKVNFFIGNKVDFNNVVLRIYYNKDQPIYNKLNINRRVDRVLNRMRNNIKFSSSI